MIRAFIVLLVNFIGLTWSLMRKLIRTLTRPLRKEQRRYVKLTLPEGLGLTGAAKKLGPVQLGPPARGAYWAFDELMRKLEDDPEIEGVFFKAERASGMGLAELGVLTDRINRLRESGKRVVCHMDQAMLKDYIVATSADTVMMTPPGRLYTFGLRMEQLFLAEAFERFGIKAQFINLGQYKTAAHRFTRRRYSRAQYLMSRQLLGDLGGSLLTRIADGRDMTVEQAQTVLDQAPMSARNARRLKFIDASLYADQIKDTLKAEGECDVPLKVVSSGEYLKQAASKEFTWKPIRGKKPVIAVMSLSGMIMMGNEGLAAKRGNVLTPRPVMRTLRALEKDANVAAVVLHIDSPGGSALASDLMWRRIRKLAESKPVIASLGNVAASGGYYIAVAAHHIVATPETITGSIGVIAGKLSGGELIEKLGVRMEGVGLGKTSGFGSLTTALSDHERGNLQRDIRAFYRRFLHRVAVGRNIPLRKLHRLARGRVYVGPRAKRLGLVDSLGDLNTAIDRACQEAGMKRDDVRVIFADHRERSDGLMALLGKGGPKRERDPFLHAEAPDAEPALTAQLAQELIPDGLLPYVATALLMRQGAALTLWPYLDAPGNDTPLLSAP